MSRHSPEPWRYHPTDLHRESVIRARDCRVICRQEKNTIDEQRETDWLRAVACVNAMAGIPDPAAELARLRAENAALLEACKAALERGTFSFDGHADSDRVDNLLRAALSSTTPAAKAGETHAHE